jgi:curved DNA-binding protein CbpA
MQLSPDAGPAAISRAYRLLALQYHPDNVETGNSEMFLRLAEAYRILSDPQKRASYDVRRHDTQLRESNHLSHLRSAVGALSGWGAALRSL